MQLEYICTECSREISPAEYDEQDENFCPNCGGIIEENTNKIWCFLDSKGHLIGPLYKEDLQKAFAGLNITAQTEIVNIVNSERKPLSEWESLQPIPQGQAASTQAVKTSTQDIDSSVTGKSENAKQGSQEACTAKILPPPQDGKIWWYAKGEQRFGPFTGNELRTIALSGGIVSTDLVWKEGITKWVPASSVKGLVPSSPATTPPPLPSANNIEPPPLQNTPEKCISYCQNCGAKLSITDSFCESCGTKVGIQKTVSPQNSTSNKLSPNEVPESWKTTFGLIEKWASGGKLSRSENFTIFINWWAFLFGPFYYLAKGMWKRAILLTTLCFVAIIAINLILDIMGISEPQQFTKSLTTAVFAGRANFDYYQQTVLNNKGWLGFTSMQKMKEALYS